MKDQWCKSLGTTFITLVSKTKWATKIKDYRLISLVSCLYKLLAKTFTLRLITTMQAVISRSHNVFILGRQTTDCSLMANECIDAMIKAGRSVIVSKIDMEKAYYHVI